MLEHALMRGFNPYGVIAAIGTRGTFFRFTPNFNELVAMNALDGQIRQT
jgi:hypothetical protein